MHAVAGSKSRSIAQRSRPLEPSYLIAGTIAARADRSLRDRDFSFMHSSWIYEDTQQEQIDRSEIETQQRTPHGLAARADRSLRDRDTVSSTVSGTNTESIRRLDILQIFAEAGAHDRISDTRHGGIWRQWSTPDVAKAARDQAHSAKALDSYHNDPFVRAANLTSKRKQRANPVKRAHEQELQNQRRRGMREKLEKTREGLVLHFTIIARVDGETPDSPARTVEVDGYVRTGTYEDGRLGEMFVTISKELAAFGPMVDAWAKAFSIGLQYGAPLELLCSKEIGTRFEPSGAVTGVAGLKRCTSPTDLICRWIMSKYAPTVEVPAVEDVVLP